MKFRTFVIIQFTVMLIIILTLFTLITFTRGSESRLIGKTIIDHEASTMIYSEHHVGVTSHVEKSDCLICLDNYPLDDCKLINLCLNVSSND